MKAVVTGGAGFIGSHLVDRLLTLGYRVAVIDDESATTHDQFYHNKKAEYYKIDICDYDATRLLYNDATYVFHLAARSRIQPTIKDPLSAARVNEVGTATVLQCSLEAGVKRVVYSSTSSIYGLKNQPPLCEEMPEDCLNPYSLSKRSGEKWCQLYAKLYKLETVILRYFNVYGDRQALRGVYAPVVGLFLKQKKEGRPLTIVPDGNQRRDFTHVLDVVKANLLASGTPGIAGEIINIGSGTNHSVLELANLISKDQIFVEERVGEARETLADNTKAMSLLGWIPSYDIESYIRDELRKQSIAD